MSTTLNIGELLNLVGLSAGIVLYAMLLAMVVRAGRTPGFNSPFDPLLLVTSVLGLVWNLYALPAYELPKMGVAGPFPYLTAVGFGALGFLPAVVVHSVLRGERQAVRGAVKRSLALAAYAVSAIAAGLHLYAAWTEAAVPAALGMRLLTYTFIALVMPLATVTRGQPGSRRALWAAALAIFAVSALHLSQLHQGDASWPVELLGHHASVPLAFAILYQDYPFALADLFLKRALALLAIVCVALAAIALFGLESVAFARFVQVDPRQVSGYAVRGNGSPLSALASSHRVVCRHHRLASTGLSVPTRNHRAHVAGERRHSSPLVGHLRTARTGVECAIRDVARVEIPDSRRRAWPCGRQWGRRRRHRELSRRRTPPWPCCHLRHRPDHRAAPVCDGHRSIDGRPSTVVR